MALPHNRQGVREILKFLEPRIIGKKLEGSNCGCGAIHCSTAIATSIEPAGNEYPGQETCWAAWSVVMTPKGHEKSFWSCGLSQFILAKELTALFAKHFPNGENDDPYKLKV